MAQNIEIAKTLLSEKKSYLWQMPNFAELQKSVVGLKKCQCTLKTSAVHKQDSQVFPLNWQCFLSSGNQEFEGDDDSDYFGLFVALRNTHFPQEWEGLFAEVRFQILDKSNKPYFNQCITMYITKEVCKTGQGRGFPNVIPKNADQSPFLTAEGALEVLVTITIKYTGNKDAHVALIQDQYEQKFVESFRSQMEFIRENPLEIKSTSTTIVSKDGVQFPVDRVILAARSPVFRGMFQSGMTEGETGLVQVKDLNSEPLEILLDFMHTGQLSENWRKEGVIEGVVYGTHKYILNDLKLFLNKTLGLVCTEENCGKLMALTRAFGMEKAEQHLLEYFKKHMLNSAEDIMHSAWDIAQNPMAIEELVKGGAKKRKICNDAESENAAVA